MALTLKQYLKQLDKQTLKKIFDEAELTELEYWLLTYAYIEHRMVFNTCAKLNISEATYHVKQNLALIKVNFIIQKYNKLQSFEI